jgi:DNA-binding transcriptional regulator YhcF (GntR family)
VEQRLKPGDLLPPLRHLGLDLGVHFNAVALAYRMLADEGWLELQRRRGAVVMARSAPQSMDRTRVDQLLQQLRHIAAELRSAGMSARSPGWRSIRGAGSPDCPYNFSCSPWS